VDEQMWRGDLARDVNCHSLGFVKVNRIRQLNTLYFSINLFELEFDQACHPTGPSMCRTGRGTAFSRAE
jgi:hypothetical protein